MIDQLIAQIRESTPGQRVGTAIGAVALIVVLTNSDLRQALVIGLINGAMYGLVALGLVLIYKSSGIFNFAQGEFGTVAIYVLWLLLERNVPYVFSVLITLAIAV